MKDEGWRKGDRVRLARGGWRPAKHIFTRRPSRMATVCASICQRPVVQNKGFVVIKSRSIKVNQSESKWIKANLLVQLAVRIVCKSMTMNNLQNKQLWPGQTMLNLVKRGQKKPIRFGFRTRLASLRLWRLCVDLPRIKKNTRARSHQGQKGKRDLAALWAKKSN